MSLFGALLATIALTGAAQARTAPQTAPDPYSAPDPYRDQRALPDSNAPAAREALLRAKGEAYHRAEDSRQTEEELRLTRALNDEIAAQNALADKADEAARLDYDAAVARHQIEVRQAEEQARAAAEATRALGGERAYVELVGSLFRPGPEDEAGDRGIPEKSGLILP